MKRDESGGRVKEGAGTCAYANAGTMSEPFAREVCMPLKCKLIEKREKSASSPPPPPSPHHHPHAYPSSV